MSDWPVGTCPAHVSSAEAALGVGPVCSDHWDRIAAALNTVVKASGPNPAEPHVHAAPSPLHETTAPHCCILYKETYTKISVKHSIYGLVKDCLNCLIMNIYGTVLPKTYFVLSRIFLIYLHNMLSNTSTE